MGLMFLLKFVILEIWLLFHHLFWKVTIMDRFWAIAKDP